MLVRRRPNCHHLRISVLLFGDLFTIIENMPRTWLGEFELMVLLAVIRLAEDAIPRSKAISSKSSGPALGRRVGIGGRQRL
jgi:hypothetical protein